MQPLILLEANTEIINNNTGNTLALVETNGLEVIVSVGGYAGGGASAFTDLTDVNVAGLTDGDFIVWDEGTSRFINLAIDVATVAQLNAHTGDTDNPHAVTAAQVQALPLAGGTLDAAAVINFTDRGDFTSDVADGAGVVGFNFNTNNTISNLRDLWKLENNGSKVFSYQKDAGSFGLGQDLVISMAGGTFDGLKFSDMGNAGYVTFTDILSNYLRFNPTGQITSSASAINIVPANNNLSITATGIAQLNDKDIGGANQRTKDMYFNYTGNLKWQYSNTDLTRYFDIYSHEFSGIDYGVVFGEASQKLAFFGTIPVTQRNTAGVTAGHTAVGGTNVNSSDTFTGNVGTRAYTINAIVKALKELGLIATN